VGENAAPEPASDSGACARETRLVRPDGIDHLDDELGWPSDSHAGPTETLQARIEALKAKLAANPDAARALWAKLLDFAQEPPPEAEDSQPEMPTLEEAEEELRAAGVDVQAFRAKTVAFVAAMRARAALDPSAPSAVAYTAHAASVAKGGVT
jgi:hypothetical protein